MEDQDYSWGLSQERIEYIIERIEGHNAHRMGAVRCPGDHGALPCELCGAAL